MSINKQVGVICECTYRDLLSANDEEWEISVGSGLGIESLGFEGCYLDIYW
jgi:hypothetical protein